MLVQYWRWISRAVQGDLARHSAQNRRERVDRGRAAPACAATVAITFAVCLALPLGVLAAVQRGRFWDRIAMGIGLVGSPCCRSGWP